MGILKKAVRKIKKAGTTVAKATQKVTKPIGRAVGIGKSSGTRAIVDTAAANIAADAVRADPAGVGKELLTPTEIPTLESAEVKKARRVAILSARNSGRRSTILGDKEY